MDWPGRMVGGSRWTASERAYAHACLRASCPSPPQHPSWWGLCALLSQHQLRHASIRPVSQLWSELLPFLLLADERIAERAVEEYLRYLDDPRQVDLQWLGLRINEALDRVETWNEALAEVLECPEGIYDARWMALLSYASLVKLQHAVALYAGDFARRRHSYWHSLDACDEPRPREPRPPRHAPRHV